MQFWNFIINDLSLKNQTFYVSQWVLKMHSTGKIETSTKISKTIFAITRRNTFNQNLRKKEQSDVLTQV
jgi:hypothetical protein